MTTKPQENNVVAFTGKAEEGSRVASLKDGYTMIADKLIQATARIEYKLSVNDRCVLDVIVLKTFGWRKSSDWIALEQFVEMTGMKKANVARTIDGLVERRILNRKTQGHSQQLSINTDISQWQKGNAPAQRRYQEEKKRIARRQQKAKTNNDNKNANNDNKSPNNDNKDVNNEYHNIERDKDTYLLKEMSELPQTIVAEQPQHEASPKKTTTVQTSSTSSEVTEIFEHWKAIMNHPRSRLDDSRKKVINKALKAGYTIDDLKTAINGCAKTAFNMGQNQQGRVYDSIDLIFRNADKIDMFIRNASLVMNNQTQHSSYRSHTDLDDISWMDGYCQSNNGHEGDLF